MIKLKIFKTVSTLVLGIAVAGAFQSANADWDVNAGGILRQIHKM